VPISKIGDCFDRYRLRILEMYQSLNIINQGVFLNLNKKQDNKYTNFKDTIYLEKSKLFRTQKTMEGVINHFKFYSANYQALPNNIFISIEAPKGEFGLSLITENSNKPYRCKIKTPGFFHLQGLDFMTRNQLLADTVAIIGTQDIVFGEIDR
jgi:NADH-quinone oxidoreductase subunit D